MAGCDRRRSVTREGTVIAFCDRFGIHACSHNTASVFEAAWGVDGATCVVRPRIAEIVSLEQLTESYPLLRGRAGARACSQDAAWHDPAALLFNQSGMKGGGE
jgi:hypothetical protein